MLNATSALEVALNISLEQRDMSRAARRLPEFEHQRHEVGRKRAEAEADLTVESQVPGEAALGRREDTAVLLHELVVAAGILDALEVAKGGCTVRPPFWRAAAPGKLL